MIFNSFNRNIQFCGDLFVAHVLISAQHEYSAAANRKRINNFIDLLCGLFKGDILIGGVALSADLFRKQGFTVERIFLLSKMTDAAIDASLVEIGFYCRL